MKPCDRVFQLMKLIFDMHIATKTSDEQYHKASASMYEAVFEAYHKTMEGMQDAGIKPSMNGQEARRKTVESLMEVKDILTKLTNENKDMAVDNILRGLVESIGFELGTAKSLLAGKAPEKKPGVGGPAAEEKDEYVKTMGVEK